MKLSKQSAISGLRASRLSLSRLFFPTHNPPGPDRIPLEKGIPLSSPLSSDDWKNGKNTYHEQFSLTGKNCQNLPLGTSESGSVWSGRCSPGTGLARRRNSWFRGSAKAKKDPRPTFLCPQKKIPGDLANENKRQRLRDARQAVPSRPCKLKVTLNTFSYIISIYVKSPYNFRNQIDY